MKQVSLCEAKTHLSKLVDEAAAGEEIVITKNGKQIARLRPLEDAHTKREPRKLGQWAEQNKNFDWDKFDRDFKALDKEIEADFEASIAKPFPGFADDGPVSVKTKRRKESSKRKAASKAGKGRRAS